MDFRSLFRHSTLSKACLLLLLLFCISCSNIAQSTNAATPKKTPASASTQTPVPGLLPGEQIWKDGVSSYLFGTNDSYEWSTHNLQTEPAIQAALRSAGFTLIRSFFPDKATDAVIETRIQTIENSGAHCLGVITNVADTSFDEHLITYLGNRCLMYEFGNEPDLNGVSIDQYLAAWNKTIPLLRAINPHAMFIGPVTYNDQGNHNYMQLFLQGVKSSGVLPDAVSFHWYPCWEDTQASCLAKATTYATVAEGVEAEVQQILDKNIPVGISEWNYDPGNPPPAFGDDPAFITQFSIQALLSMMQAHVAFACQFDAADYGGYGRLDMFNVENNQPKPQYYAIKTVIANYQPSNVTPTTSN
jgi:hypothetical protein